MAWIVLENKVEYQDTVRVNIKLVCAWAYTPPYICSDVQNKNAKNFNKFEGWSMQAAIEFRNTFFRNFFTPWI